MHVKLIHFINSFPYNQSISEPTNFTEKSISLTSVLLLSNKDRIIFNGVCDLFLQQDLCYHCSVFGYSISLNLKLNVSSAVYGNMIGVIMIF